MGHVDALSRCHEKTSTDEINVNRFPEQQEADRTADTKTIIAVVEPDDVDFRLQVTQNRDPTIVEIKGQLEKEKMDDYLLKDGLVYRKLKNNDLLLYVPAEMEENVIRLIHEKIGHLSVDKCCDQIRMNYWFPKMQSKVGKFIKNCLKCIMYAAPTRATERNFYSIPKKPIPFDTVHLDHFGPLPALISKRKHLLVVIDAFTKFVKLYPVNSTSTKEINASLDKYFANYSRPRRVITDRGSCFRSLELTEYLQQNNIEQVQVAVASPQANGQVERVNRVIKPMLGKLSEPISHADWSHKLLQVEYALNNSVHSTTKKIPSELLFGVRQRGEVIDELTEYLEENSNRSTNLQEIRSEALEAIEKSQKYATERALMKNKPAKKYKVGDYVVILNVDTKVGRNKKFIPKYRGPYVVYKELGHDRYVIRDIENCQLTQLPYDGVVEANRIHKWLSPLESGEIDRPTGKGDTESEEDDQSPSEVPELTINDDLSDDEEEFMGFDVQRIPATGDRGRSRVRSAEL